MAQWPKWSGFKAFSGKLAGEILKGWLLWVWQPFQFQFPRASRWIADWGWAGLMIAAATAAGVQEYLIALVFVLLAAVSLTASSFHWDKIEGWPRLTLVRHIGGVVLALLLVVLGILSVLGLKADQPWSRIPAGWHVVRAFLKKPSMVPAHQGNQKKNPAFPEPITEPPSQATISQNRKPGSTHIQYLYIANNGARSITKYRINDDGRLSSSNKVTPVDPGFGQLGPLVTDGNILLLGEPFRSGMPGSSALLLYDINSDGSITRTDLLEEAGYFPIALDSKARVVYTGGDGQRITAAAITVDHKFVRLPGSPFRPPCPAGLLPPPESMCSNSLDAVSLRVTQDDKFLYGIFDDTSHFGLLGTITRNSDGTLGRFVDFVDSARLPCTNLRTKPLIGSLIVASKPQQTFLFQSCVDDDGRYTIGSSAVDPTSGKITAIFSEFRSSGNLFPILADPSGKWLLAFDTQPYQAGKIHVLFIEPNTGALTEPPNHEFPSSGDLLAFDHQGKFLYIANSVNNEVTAYRFDSHSGVMNVPGTTFPTGQQPTAIVVAHPR